MRDILSVVDSWLADSGQVALATVVSTWGSAPRGAGSHMVINLDGEMAGSVSGGCVEGAVVEAADMVLREGRPEMLEFGVADELAWDVGLACGGRIAVWVEPLRRDAIYTALRAGLLEGATSVLCTALDGPSVGAKLLVRAGGGAVGDLGDIQRDAIDAALSAADGGSPTVVELAGTKLFVQPYLPPPRLIVIGAVHTAIALVALGKTLGYDVTVVDARAAFATRERFPDAGELIVEWPDAALARLKPDINTAVVVLTHDAKFDEPALASALESEAGYIGAIGSRATSADRLVRLRSMGFSTEQLERVHGPIGLDIGAATPAETALSILAEIVAHQHNRSGGRLRLAVKEHIA